MKDENARAEYQALRREILHADRVCLVLMGYLVAATGAVGASFANGSNNAFALWVLGPIWLIGFWYFTEKRFVVKRNGQYIKYFIEKKMEGYGWQSFLDELRESKSIRPALPLGPYYLEAVVAGSTILAIPVIGIYENIWPAIGWHSITSVFIALLYLFVAIRSVRAYKKYDVSIVGRSA